MWAWRPSRLIAALCTPPSHNIPFEREAKSVDPKSAAASALTREQKYFYLVFKHLCWNLTSIYKNKHWIFLRYFKPKSPFSTTFLEEIRNFKFFFINLEINGAGTFWTQYRLHQCHRSVSNYSQVFISERETWHKIV